MLSFFFSVSCFIFWRVSHFYFSILLSNFLKFSLIFFEFPRALPCFLKALFLQNSAFYFMQEAFYLFESNLVLIFSALSLLPAPSPPNLCIDLDAVFHMRAFPKNKCWDIFSYSRVKVLDWDPWKMDSG